MLEAKLTANSEANTGLLSGAKEPRATRKGVGDSVLRNAIFGLGVLDIL